MLIVCGEFNHNSLLAGLTKNTKIDILGLIKEINNGEREREREKERERERERESSKISDIKNISLISFIL